MPRNGTEATTEDRTLTKEERSALNKAAHHEKRAGEEERRLRAKLRDRHAERECAKRAAEEVLAPTPYRPRPAVHYTDELFDELLERLTNGESLTDICQMDHMPTASGVFRWVSADPERAVQYAEAMRVRASRDVDMLLKAAVIGTGDVARDRLIVESLRWAAGKRDPRSYSDRLQIAADVRALNHTVVETKMTQCMSPEELATNYAALLEGLKAEGQTNG